MRLFFCLLLVLALPSPAALRADDPRPVRVLVWDEQQPAQKEAYGDRFLGETIAAYLAEQPGFVVKAVKLDSPGQGLDEATLDATDVLIWWGHILHPEVRDENVERVVSRVRDGRLALIALHSAHWAKPFVRLMQERAKADALMLIPPGEREGVKWEFLNEVTKYQAPKRDALLTPNLSHEGGVYRLALPLCVFPAYRPDGAPSHVTMLLTDHPIAAGLPSRWDVARTEMYDEPFHVPAPDEVVLEERWDRGEHFRSGCVWQVGQGRVFYFRPGHETFPVFKQKEPLKVLENAARWLGAGRNR